MPNRAVLVRVMFHDDVVWVEDARRSSWVDGRDLDARCAHVDLGDQVVVVLLNLVHRVIGIARMITGRRRPPLASTSKATNGWNRGTNPLSFGQLCAVNQEGDIDGFCLDVAHVHHLGGDGDRVSDLRDADVHGETRWHHQWVWTQVVHALTGHRDGVRLRTASSVVGILHLDLPNALLGRVDEHHFDVVERVSGPGLDAAAVAEHVPG